MPGILYHLGFAEMVFENLRFASGLNKAEFMAGNIIPDLAVDKLRSHYRISASVAGFFVPELSVARKELLFNQCNSVKLGIYCHLYLDYHFIEEYLIPGFIWDYENMKVINPRNKKEWNVEKFFSINGMYGAYSEMSQFLIQESRFPLELIRRLPEKLPDTGLEIFDVRRNNSWKKEVEEYIAEKRAYKGEIFDYKSLWGYIELLVSKLVEEYSE